MFPPKKNIDTFLNYNKLDRLKIYSAVILYFIAFRISIIIEDKYKKVHKIM